MISGCYVLKSCIVSSLYGEEKRLKLQIQTMCSNVFLQQLLNQTLFCFICETNWLIMSLSSVSCPVLDIQVLKSKIKLQTFSSRHERFDSGNVFERIRRLNRGLSLFFLHRFSHVDLCFSWSLLKRCFILSAMHWCSKVPCVNIDTEIIIYDLWWVSYFICYDFQTAAVTHLDVRVQINTRGSCFRNKAKRLRSDHRLRSWGFIPVFGLKKYVLFF